MPAPQDRLERAADAIAARRRALIAAYPTAWPAMLDAWARPGRDAMWLMYSANYLLRTADVRWAVDPVTLANRAGDAPPVDVDALADLSCIVMTHAHGDHIDRALLAKLATMPITWIVPEPMAAVAAAAGIDAKRIIVPQPLVPIEYDGLRITPFAGLHWEYPGAWGEGEPRAGIDATGYLIKWDGGSLLLPGDTRTYQPAALPDFGAFDTLVGHIWLGREAACLDDPPLFDALCDFLVALRPARRIVLTHLWEVRRGPEDYWDRHHADRVRERLLARLDDVAVDVPDFWEMLPL